MENAILMASGLGTRPVWGNQITEIDTVEELEAVNSNWHR